jgi:hypothetical protein
MYNKLLLIFLSLFYFNAYCGERGYYLFISGNKDGKEFYQSYRSKNKTYEENQSCWQKRSGAEISTSYVKTVPAGITPQLIDNAMNGEISSLNILRYKLSSFHDDQIAHGFDAMINIEKHNDNAILTLVPLQGKIVTEKVISSDFQSLDLGLCKVLFAVDNYFAP